MCWARLYVAYYVRCSKFTVYRNTYFSSIMNVQLNDFSPNCARAREGFSDQVIGTESAVTLGFALVAASFRGDPLRVDLCLAYNEDENFLCNFCLEVEDRWTPYIAKAKLRQFSPHWIASKSQPKLKKDQFKTASGGTRVACANLALNR